MSELFGFYLGFIVGVVAANITLIVLCHFLRKKKGGSRK